MKNPKVVGLVTAILVLAGSIPQGTLLASSASGNQAPRLHVISVGMDTDPAAQDQLRQIAAASGGTYQAADDMEALIASMKTAAHGGLSQLILDWVQRHVAFVMLVLVLMIVALVAIIIALKSRHRIRRVSFTVVYPNGAQKIFQLRWGRHLVGRAPHSSVRLHPDDTLCSRNHAELVISATGVAIRDLGSQNGTWLAGSPRNEFHRVGTDSLTPLHPGTMIRVGSHTLWAMNA